MEDGSRNNEEACPKLLDLMSKERGQWFCKQDAIKLSDDSKLELKLGPPGEERRHHEPLLSLGFGNVNQQSRTSHNHNFTHVWFMQQKQQERSGGVMVKESSQHCCSSKVGAAVDMHQKLQQQQQTGADNNNDNTGTAVATSSSQKRTAPGPVVGWPPIRSFRKNLAASSNSSKAPLDGQNGNENPNKKVATEKPGLDNTCKKGLFVKINMDGVPIGRKVDLKAYDSYEKLSVAVDELFRGLLAAQRDSSGDRISNKKDEEEGILKGSGEYTLVYEDNEGDRMLVGDVPWHMFISTVKRLRVLKSSEVSALRLGGSKQEKINCTFEMEGL